MPDGALPVPEEVGDVFSSGRAWTGLPDARTGTNARRYASIAAAGQIVTPGTRYSRSGAAFKLLPGSASAPPRYNSRTA